MPCVAELGPVETLGARFGMYQLVIGLGCVMPRNDVSRYEADDEQCPNKPPDPRIAHPAGSRLFRAPDHFFGYLCSWWLDDYLSS